MGLIADFFKYRCGNILFYAVIFSLLGIAAKSELDYQGVFSWPLFLAMLTAALLGSIGGNVAYCALNPSWHNER